MQYFPEHLIEQQLIARNITDSQVLNAMRSVPRHAFLPETLHELAYEDRALPIDQDQTISQPYIVARMAQELKIQAQDHILEVGTGSGYAAAVLSLLGHSVITIERHAQLAQKAATICTQLGYTNIQFHWSDGSIGWPQAAPYDAISVAANAPEVPQPLLDQLAPHGRLVLPVGSVDTQYLLRVVRTDQGFEETNLGPVRFVPLIGDAGWEA